MSYAGSPTPTSNGRHVVLPVRHANQVETPRSTFGEQEFGSSNTPTTGRLLGAKPPFSFLVAATGLTLFADLRSHAMDPHFRGCQSAQPSDADATSRRPCLER